MGSSISGLGEGLQWFGVPFLTGGVTEVYGESLSAVAESPWLTKSEKERIEDLLLSGSLAIPPPQINIAALYFTALAAGTNLILGQYALFALMSILFFLNISLERSV